MRYFDPALVTSPKDLIRRVDVLHNGGDGGVSVARLDWDGKICLGMRWNIAKREWDDPDKINESKICTGMPTSRGYPVWFIVPDDFFNPGSELYNAIKEKL